MLHADVLNQIVDEYHTNLIPGWCPLEKAMDLASIVLSIRPDIVVETGVFGGKSLIPMALAIRSQPVGCVIGIDPWSPSASSEGYSGINAEWWSSLNHESLYQGFMQNLNRLGLTNVVKVLRQKSDDANVPHVIDIAHFDSQHTDQVIREIDRFGTHVRIGGIVVLDDIEWVNDGDAPVKRGIDHLLSLGFIELYRTVQSNGNWGVFQRVK